ncbi:hypothetical protein SAMN05444166_1084 [Singulisphaera sp. GP187]|nr:hypothetical protein SAMN05444166_1084 [Singulisphaera sp. GP187]
MDSEVRAIVNIAGFPGVRGQNRAVLSVGSARNSTYDASFAAKDDLAGWAASGPDFLLVSCPNHSRLAE